MTVNCTAIRERMAAKTNRLRVTAITDAEQPNKASATKVRRRSLPPMERYAGTKKRSITLDEYSSNHARDVVASWRGVSSLLPNFPVTADANNRILKPTRTPI